MHDEQPVDTRRQIEQDGKQSNSADCARQQTAHHRQPGGEPSHRICSCREHRIGGPAFAGSRLERER
ncbi:hypothetical protein RZS08_48215, partial [Arthrospira platensis SPKY1]|nr:hypothetical protein [Arthrospira platensis SPKY1]